MGPGGRCVLFETDRQEKKLASTSSNVNGYIFTLIFFLVLYSINFITDNTIFPRPIVNLFESIRIAILRRVGFALFGP